MAGTIKDLKKLHQQQIELLDEYQEAKDLKGLLEKYGRYFILQYDERAMDSMYGKAKWYMLISHKGEVVKT